MAFLFAIKTIYLNAALIPDLDTTQLVSHSLYGIIEQDYNIHIHHGNQNIQAIVSDYKSFFSSWSSDTNLYATD